MENTNNPISNVIPAAAQRKAGILLISCCIHTVRFRISFAKLHDSGMTFWNEFGDVLVLGRTLLTIQRNKSRFKEYPGVILIILVTL